MSISTMGPITYFLSYISLILLPTVLGFAQLPFIYSRFNANVPDPHIPAYLRRALLGPLIVHFTCLLGMDCVLCFYDYSLAVRGRDGFADLSFDITVIICGTFTGSIISTLSLINVALDPDIVRNIWRKISCGGVGNEDGEESVPLVRDNTTFYASTTVPCGTCQKRYDQERIIREYC